MGVEAQQRVFMCSALGHMGTWAHGAHCGVNVFFGWVLDCRSCYFFCAARFCVNSMARSKPRALLSVSWYSLSGSLSATIPAPACT
jgi:hypothetical protein